MLKKRLNENRNETLTNCERLKLRATDGIVIRTVYPEVPPQIGYKLSKLGESMRPIIFAMESWGVTYLEEMNKDIF